MMRRRAVAILVLVSAASLVAVGVNGPIAAAAADGPRGLVGPLADVAEGARPARPPRSPLVADASAHAKQKADANAAASEGAAAPDGPVSFAPVLSRSWQGWDNSCCAPSDSTSAIGTSRFVELMNGSYAIYDRTSDTPLETGSDNFLVGSAAGSVFDPQVIWDPGTKRFYYVWDQVESTTDHRIALGFSRTASPNTGSSTDWCKYSYGYGSEFPDFPKLGDTKNFLLVGVNVFDTAGAFLRSDVNWLSKPAAGTACPAASTFAFGTKSDLKDKAGAQVFTPVPANQTDTSSAGWIVARALSLPSTFISVYKVTRDSVTGAAKFSSAKKLTVPSYSVPADAAQPGTARKLDTSDTRMTQAVSAIDPSRGTGSSVAIWTQHTVLGGAGAQVRWYEIDPITTTLFQSGTVSDPSFYIFNAAVSPDRKVTGSTKLFGANMVIGVNTSSSTQVADFRTASKVGAAPLSPLLGVVISGGPVTTSCGPVSCRWGDYAAATPDPAASATGSVGKVWLTTQLTYGGSIFDWATWNAAVAP